MRIVRRLGSMPARRGGEFNRRRPDAFEPDDDSYAFIGTRVDPADVDG